METNTEIAKRLTADEWWASDALDSALYGWARLEAAKQLVLLARHAKGPVMVSGEDMELICPNGETMV